MELVLVIQPAIHGRQFTIHLERCILPLEIFGVKTAVLLRIGANIFATLYTVMFNHIFNNVFAFIKNRKENLITE